MRELPVKSVMWRLCRHLALPCGENPEASRGGPWKLPASGLELQLQELPVLRSSSSQNSLVCEEIIVSLKQF